MDKKVVMVGLAGVAVAAVAAVVAYSKGKRAGWKEYSLEGSDTAGIGFLTAVHTPQSLNRIPVRIGSLYVTKNGSLQPRMQASLASVARRYRRGVTL